ncbi:MAG: SusC/RagA family TonB-linked outer membrane protein [Gemmatimonadota bacterium]
MKRVAGVRGVLALVALFLSALAATASAQGGAIISGKVTSEAGAPLAGANVFIQSLNIATQSSPTGSYSLVIPAGRATGSVTLSARYIGYVRQNRAITVSSGSQTQDFSLKADPFRLDEVVVTGVANATSAANIPFSVGKVSEEQLKEVPAASPVAALAGKVSGVKVALGTGNPGAAPVIRLRGSTSLTVGASTPLIIVDGVITKYNIADIDANDIASIEVLKGAAAASFYGSDAANGVVNITTKRGGDLTDNKLNFAVRSEYGQSGISHFVPLNTAHDYVTNADGTIATAANGTRTVKADHFADNKYPSTGPSAYRDQLQTWLQDGAFYSANVQMGLRRGNTNFNSSFTNDHNQGILPLTNGQFRQNLRLNVDQGITDKADFSASITYGIGKNDYNPNSSNGFFALLQAPPDVDLLHPSTTDTTSYFPLLPVASSPSARGNPLYEYANTDYTFRRERLLGSFSARYRPTNWLRVEGSYGTDRLNTRNTTFQFRGYLSSQGLPTNGFYNINSSNNVAENTQINSTATKLLFGDVLSTTRLAYLLETTDANNDATQGNKLNVTGVQDLQALDPTRLATSSGYEAAHTIDYQASQNFTIKDRYIIDAQIRRDGSSLFGPESRWQNFYRVAGAYRISEDFKLPGVQELKLRAARGTAGLRPNFNDQYETYSLGAGVATKAQLGNKALKPAVQTEDEYGVNVGFMDHFDLEVVQANRKTTDAFLTVPLSLAQSGGFLSQVQNIATVSAKTTELSLQTRVVDRPNFSYSFGITGDHTTQRIDKLGVAPFRVGGLGQGQDVFYYKEGENLGIMYGAKWVRSFAQLKENPAFASAVESDYVVNPIGFLVTKATRGLPTEKPIAYTDATGQTQFKIGDVNPDFSFGFSNNFKIHGFGVYALFDGQKGGDIYNFTKQWMFQDLRHADEDQSNKPQDQKINQEFYSGALYNGLVASDHFIENGTYVKLRELSVSYDLGVRQLDRVGLGKYASNVKLALIGRNLHTWTNYTGFDPEVTAGGDFNTRIDGFRYPQFRTITGQVSIGF